MQMPSTILDGEEYCLQQLRVYLARARSGRLTLHLPAPTGLWLRIPGSCFHAAPELFLQPSGGTQFRFPAGDFLLRAGQSCLLPAGLPHADGPVANPKPFRHMVVMIRSPREISVHLTLRHTSGEGRTNIVYSRQILGPATANSLQLYYVDLLSTVRGRYWKPRTSGLMTALFATILENWTSPTLISPSENIKIARCKQLLFTRLSDPDLGVTSLSHQLECSPDYLSALFHKECGMSLIAWLTCARMEQAVFLLRNTTMRIKEIAAACGFARPSYFIHVFRHRQGTSPLQYRRMDSGINQRLDRQAYA